jgi:hypothetical protein
MDQAPSTSNYHTTSQVTPQPIINQTDLNTNASTPFNQLTYTAQSGDPMQLSTIEYPPLPSQHHQEWRTVHYGTKRQGHYEESGVEPTQRKKQAYWLDQPTPTHNRFQNLPTDEMESSTANINKEPKPPPIYVAGVKLIQPLIQLLDEMAKDNYIVKTLRNDQVKIQPLQSKVFSTIIHALKERNTEFFTYKSKQDKTFRVVLKNIHPSTDPKEISHCLMEQGHEVVNIWNVKQRQTNIPLPLFFIDLKTQTNNKDIYNIKLLLNTSVQFEAPHAKREIPQCIRCQKYGHTKNYCYNKPCCVKCARHHLTKDCTTKTLNEDVLCVNCKGHHPANYRGCIIHKQLQQKLFPTLRERPNYSRTTQPGISYAQIVKPQIPQPIPREQTTPDTTPQQTHEISELKQMMQQLMNQMGTLINLISALITKTP